MATSSSHKCRSRSWNQASGGHSFAAWTSLTILGSKTILIIAFFALIISWHYEKLERLIEGDKALTFFPQPLRIKLVLPHLSIDEELELQDAPSSFLNLVWFAARKRFDINHGWIKLNEVYGMESRDLLRVAEHIAERTNGTSPPQQHESQSEAQQIKSELFQRGARKWVLDINPESVHSLNLELLISWLPAFSGQPEETKLRKIIGELRAHPS